MLRARIVWMFIIIAVSRTIVPAQSPTSDAPRTASPATLDELVQEALERHPAIQAARRLVDAKRAMIAPAQTLPEPTITFQTMGELLPPVLQSGDPASARAVSIEQDIPFPGKLELKGRMASMEAEAEWWNYEQTRRAIIADVKLAYYDLYHIEESINVVEKNKELLQKFLQIADARYRVGQGNQQDLLKAQVEISKLIDRLTVLKQQHDITEARLNTLLYRPPGSHMAVTTHAHKAELRYTLEELYQLACRNFPELKAQEREIDRQHYAVQLARKQFYPDFSVGFTYFNRAATPEMYGLSVKAKIPLYFWRRQRPELDSAASTLAGAQKQRDNLLSLLYFRVKDAYLAATTSERLMQLYGHAVIPQATLSLESAVANYQVGKVDFLTLIDDLTTLLDYELKYHEALVEYQKALARLEVFVGLELTK
ncbi:MAG: TolC family protein [Acidobacteriota bacterium]|nr:TolC family protein [Blastocatellia bacterium]MDW8239595.1 TolC family protein [Acidobacteriota bacterium]